MKKQSSTRAGRKLAVQRHRARIKARRPLHKKLLLHPASVMMLLCLGVLLATWTVKTNALSYGVHGVVPAAPLSEPAVFAASADGTHLSSTPTTLSGTCPYPSYVEIMRDDTLVGTAICSAEGTYSLQVGLLPGLNLLLPQDYNITDSAGPLGTAISIYYDPPVAPSSSAQQSTASAATKSSSPLVLTSNYQYSGYGVGEQLAWTVNLNGGQAPYAFNVKWGDGSESNYVAASPGDLTIQHVFKTPNLYGVKITTTDSAGQSAFLQLGALVVKDKSELITGSLTASGGGGGLRAATEISGSAWRKLLLPSYGVLGLMVTSFWLGEHQQAWQLARRTHLKRRGR